ncbi:hypothetical protein JL720_16453 [Aureococcus anophagefferens]|nr:hypothetical protein JL720_16453 [Aureococcus anophagefferens]
MLIRNSDTGQMMELDLATGDMKPLSDGPPQTPTADAGSPKARTRPTTSSTRRGLRVKDLAAGTPLEAPVNDYEASATAARWEVETTLMPAMFGERLDPSAAGARAEYARNAVKMERAQAAYEDATAASMRAIDAGVDGRWVELGAVVTALLEPS